MDRVLGDVARGDVAALASYFARLTERLAGEAPISRMFGMLDAVDVLVPHQVEAIHHAYMQAVQGSANGRAVLTEIARGLPVDAVVLAGTDLALIFDETNTPFPYIDATRFRIEAILRQVRAGAIQRTSSGALRAERVTLNETMWQQTYTPIAGNLWLSALVAAVPVFALLFALGVKRIPAWKSSLIGLAASIVVAVAVYRMPAGLMGSAVLYGAAFGLFPIGWIIYWAIVLYRVTVEMGQFEIIKNSVGTLTDDKRLQALLIAFAFGAFIEGASGFGTPVAVAAAMLTGLGFTPFYAAGICLLANTAPVAFGAIGIPLVTLAGITGLPLRSLSADVGRICAPVSLFIPAYLIIVMGGWRALKGVLPGAAVCGIAFAATQFTVSNFFSVYVTDILSSLAAICCLVVLLHVWKPRTVMQDGGVPVQARRHSAGEILYAWSPYALLVVFVSLWGFDAVKVWLNKATWNIAWAGLHNQILRMPPVVAKPSPYPAIYTLNVLSAAGTSCMFAAIGAAVLLRMKPAHFLRLIVSTARQLLFAMVTLAAVLALAFLMNYCGATATLGLAFAATGVFFPFFSSLLGWLGVFLTGSDTSANALFGNLQVVTANSLHLKPVLMAASNSAGGVMGKMISLQSIAVAAAATGMPHEDEARLFRFTLRHSILLATIIGLVVLFYSYVMPDWAN